MAALAPPVGTSPAATVGLALSASNGVATTNGAGSSSGSPAATSTAPPTKASRSASSSLPVAAPGIYPSDSVRVRQMAAESIGLSNLDESVAVGLAGDVEFRLHQVIEEAQKFMRHSRRTTMTPADINHALSALSIEPIYGHLPLPSSTPHFLPLKLPPSLAATAANTGSQKAKSAMGSGSTTALAVSQASSSSGGGDIYFLSDPEVDFARMLAAPPPGLAGGGVRWRAHWLAVEGVMPRVPENVAPDYQAYRAAGPTANGGSQQAAAAYLANGSTSASSAVGGPTAATSKGAKPALSQELQLYFSRLTAALLPSVEARAINASTVAAAAAAAAAAADSSATPGAVAGLPAAAVPAPVAVAELSEAERARLAALASLRGDTGLQGLVVYLVRWLGEKVAANLAHLAELSSLLEAVNALVANQTLFLEPFLHQILPIILSPLLTSPLGGGPSPVPPQGKALAPEPTTTEVRQLAAEVLGVLVREFGSVYETLVPRLTKTLLRSLAPPHPAGRVQGALLGLGALGRHAVWRALWGGEADGVSSRKQQEAGAAGARSSKRLKTRRKDGRPGAVRGPERLRAWTEGWAVNASWSEDDRALVVAAAFSVLPKLVSGHRTSPSSGPAVVSEVAVKDALTMAFGSTLGGLLATDKWLAKKLLELSPDEPLAAPGVEAAEALASSTPAPASTPTLAATQLDMPAAAPTGEPQPASTVESTSADGLQPAPLSAAPPETAVTGEEDVRMDGDAPAPALAASEPSIAAATVPALSAAETEPAVAEAPPAPATEEAASVATPVEAADADDDDDEEMEAVP